MKKQILIGLISFSSILSLNGQIYTPSGIIQGSSGNNNVGIGKTSPLSKLEVYASTSTEIAKFSGVNNLNYSTLKVLGGTANNPYWRGIFIGANIKMNSTYPEIETSGFRGTAIGFGTDAGEGHIGFFTTSSTTSGNVLNENMRISPTGNIGIGTTSPAYKLDVKGTIRSCEVIVNTENGCDFVFKNDYKLMDLKKLEEYVKTKQHLPEIASEKEMVENGVNMKDLQMKLLQKMEEMTLYMIEQNKKLEQQNEKITALENEMKEMKKK